MTILTDELEVIIQKAALDGALTQDAVAQFHALVTERDALKTELSSLRDDLSKKTKDCETLRLERDSARDIRGTFKARIESLDEREKEMTKLEMSAAHQAERVKDHKEMFTTVFRNSVLRKEVMTPVGAGPIDQYGTKQSDVYPSKDTVEEEET